VDDYIVRDKGYNDVETFDFSVTPESTYMNTQTKIQFSLEGGNTSAYSMSADGKLSVNVYQLSDKQNFATIKAAVTQYENGSFVTENITKKIEIWNRPAQLGDVVYYDGSYSSVEQSSEIEKTIIGVCFFTAPRYTSNTDGHQKDDIVEEIFNPNDIQQRLLVALDYADIDRVYEGADYNGAWVWGIKEWEFKASNLYVTDENGNNAFITMDGKMLDDTGQKTYISDFTVTDESFRSEDAIGVLNAGFKAIDAATLGGLGLAYKETEDMRQYRTLKSDNEWMNEASDYYKKFMNNSKLVNNGYSETLKVIHHRNSYIVGDGTSRIDNFKNENGKAIDIHLYKPVKEKGYTELESLANCMESVSNYFKNEFGYADYISWQQLLFPAASAAYAYEPRVESTEVLNERLVRHNWFLGSPTMLGRIGWYLKQGNDSQYNIFAPAAKKGLIREFYLWGRNSTATVFMRHANIGCRFDNGLIASAGKSDRNFVIPICAF
jgi:hypothetical protein